MAIDTKAAAIGGIFLAGLAGWQYTEASSAKKANVDLTHQLADKKGADLGAARQACSARSQRYFTLLGFDESKAKDGTTTTFRNHYSARLGKCLMTLEATSFNGGHEVVSKSLIDTDEHTSFGEYAWVSSDTKKAYEQRPMQCAITPPDAAESSCHSTDEYEAYLTEMLAS